MENWKYLKAVTEWLGYTACKDIFQQGQSQDEESSNRGCCHKLWMVDASVQKNVASILSDSKSIHHDNTELNA